MESYNECLDLKRRWYSNELTCVLLFCREENFQIVWILRSKSVSLRIFREFDINLFVSWLDFRTQSLLEIVGFKKKLKSHPIAYKRFLNNSKTHENSTSFRYICKNARIYSKFRLFLQEKFSAQLK